LVDRGVAVSAKIRGFFSAFIRVKSVDLPLFASIPDRYGFHPPRTRSTEYSVA